MQNNVILIKNNMYFCIVILISFLTNQLKGYEKIILSYCSHDSTFDYIV